jgi:hypothetical protein
MAIFSREDQIDDRLVHHSDRGVQPGFKGSSQHCLAGARVGDR